MKPSGIAWIGSIPLAWDTKRIKYVISDIKDGTHGTFDRVESGEPLLSAKNVFDDGIRIGNNESEISYTDYSSIVSNGFPQKNDVLLCCVGTIGRCCIYEFDKPKAFQRSVSFLRPLSSTSARFLKYALQSDSTLVQEQLLLNKSAQEGLYMGSVREMVIALPNSYHIQESIADFLDAKCTKIDGIIADIEKQIEILQKYKKSVISETLRKGTEKKVDLKDSDIDIVGSVGKTWTIKRLKYLCKIQTGSQDTQDAVDEGQYPFYVRSPIVERIDKYVFDGEAVLMAGDGVGAGRIFHYVNDKFGCHQRVYIINSLKHVIGKFLYYYMQSFFSLEVEKGSAKSTVDSIRLPMLQNFLVCYPTIAEQNKIVEYLDKKCADIDDVISTKEKQLDTIQQHKKSLVYEYVTGKKRVTEVN